MSGYNGVMSSYKNVMSGYKDFVSGYKNVTTGYKDFVSSYNGLVSGYKDLTVNCAIHFLLGRVQTKGKRGKSG
jgi:hypothetical protein